MRTRGVTVTFSAIALAGFAAWLAVSTARGAAARDAMSSRAVPDAPAPQTAEGFEWFWAINGPVSGDAGSDLSVDEEGNVFLGGAHGGLDMDRDGVVDFQSGGTAYEGAHNSFFMKLNRGPSDDRVRLRWMRSPRTPADRSQSRVAADGRGGVYVTGAFAESLSFESGPTLGGAGGNDAYIARYDGEGSVVWARVFGGPGGDGIYGVASDRAANAYVVGVGSGTFPLDDRGTEFRASGERAAALISYGPDGAVRWARIFGSGVPLAYGVKVAPNGEVYLTGELAAAADFDDDGNVDLPAPRDRDGFVARFDPDGGFLEAWSVPIPGYPAFAEDGDVFLGSAMGGPLEERYGQPDFDGDGRPDIQLKGGGPTGAWVARYSPEGELRWVRSYTLEQPADIEVLGGLIALSGHYKGVRDLDEDGVPERVDRTVDPSLEWELAILILSTDDGRPERVWTAPGPGNDWAHAVAFLPNEPALVVTGAIQLTADFTGDGEAGEGWAVCENLGDVFFAQYRLGERRADHLATSPEEREADPEERPQEPSEIGFEASLAEREGRLEADLVWSATTTDQIEVYRNDELVATVANGGSHIDVIPRGTARPYRYRVCEVGTTRCSASVEAGF